MENVYKFSYVITLAFSIFRFRLRNAMLKSICEVLDLERSGVNSELVKRILNFLMHPKPSGKVRINFYYFSNKSILFSLSFLSLSLSFLMNILIAALLSVFSNIFYIQRMPLVDIPATILIEKTEKAYRCVLPYQA